MAGDCGTCTMCCKLMAVTELKKPKFTQCEHCDIGVGCKIYETRPEGCAAFRCLWLQTQTAGPKALTLAMRPDKSKVVLHVSADQKSVIAKVDPKHPNAWREKEIGMMLGLIAENLFVLVQNGKQNFILRNGTARECIMSEVDQEGNESFVRYVDD